jgi:hypothetical protein
MVDFLKTLVIMGIFYTFVTVNITFYKMKAFFEGIQTLFVDFLFKPLDWLRALELSNWWLANIVSWSLMIVCAKYIIYWCKELQKHQNNNEENQDTTAHSFLK